MGNLRPYLIGIAGCSGAGKSELAAGLSAALPARILSLDSYYRDLSHLPVERRAETNFDVPEALEEELLTEHLALLARGEAVEKPMYDFAQHVRLAVGERVEPGEFLIVEGLFTLYWQSVRDRLALKIFVEAPDAICFERRLERDVRQRGRTAESVREQYERTVRPMAERYILPTRQFADLVVSGVDPPEHTLQKVLETIRQRVAGQRSEAPPES